MRRASSAILLFAWAGCGASPPAPPSGLSVLAATAARVDLSWTAGSSKGVDGYVVERADAGENVYSAIGTATGTTASDTTVDPNTGYSYRVRATAKTQTSAPSNAVTAGPPPKPFSVVASAPAGAASGHFGSQLSMALDANGDPAVAWVNLDDGSLWFDRWDRAAYAWVAPVKVATVGPIDATAGQQQVSLARDASNGTWGVAYEALLDANDMNHRIDLATSTDNGQTWTAKTLPVPVSVSPPNPVTNPSLVLRSGQVHAVYQRANQGLCYVTGMQGTDPATWNPLITDNSLTPVNVPAGFAVDASGHARAAYWVTSTTGSGLQLAYWSGGFTSMTFADTGGLAESAPSVALAFAGTEARLVVGAAHPAGFPVWAMKLAGMTWSTPVTVTPDGSAPKGDRVALAVGSMGQAAAMYPSGAGGTCGNPKLATSTDFAAWNTCSPDRGTNASSEYPSLAYGTNDQLSGAFQALDGSVDGGPGVVVWRQ